MAPRSERAQEASGAAGSGDARRVRRPSGRAWGRLGEVLYARVSVVVVVVEAIALSGLVWALLFSGAVSRPAPSVLGDALIAAVSVTAALLTAVTAVMTFLSGSEVRREAMRRERIDSWTVTWTGVLEGSEPCPPGPLDGDAVAALLEVREEASGEEALAAASAIRSTGADRQLVDALEAVSRRGRRGGRAPADRLVRERRGPLHRRVPLGALLDLLDDLARARIPDVVPLVLELAGRRERAVRIQAIRVAARSIAVIGPSREQAVALGQFLDGLARARLPRGALEESVLLLDAAAEPLIRRVLADPDAEPVLLAACLESLGRLRLDDLGPSLVPFLGPDRPLDVRAAALRALAAMPALPFLAEVALHEALTDAHEAVRVQAVRASRLLPLVNAVAELTSHLGDRSWWVRRAAAETLVALGPSGTAALRRAARAHPDRYARQMAEQVLQDRRAEALAPMVRESA